MAERGTVREKGVPTVSQNEVEMPGDQSCCLGCAVEIADKEKLKNLLDIYGLSDSQALFMGYDMLNRALACRNDWFQTFLSEDDAKANSEGESKSETPLYWNGAPLRHAVVTRGIEAFFEKLMLQENYVIDEPTSHDHLGLLYMAAKLDNTGIAQVLLDHLDHNEIPVRYAVVMNNLKTVKSLLQANFDVNQRFYQNSNVFKMAIRLARKQIFDVFLETLSFNESLLYTAAERNNTDDMEMLLLKNADVEERSYNELTPLHIAAQLGNTQCAKLLLDAGADTNSVCASALDALVIAAVNNDDEALVELLLRKGVKINMMTNGYRGTLLDLASKNPELKVARLLLNNGFDINARDVYNKNLLQNAITRDNFQLIEMIIEFCSNLESPTVETKSKIFKDLLQYGFGESSDHDNEWYLEKAIRSGCLKIVEYFLTLGTNVNTKCEAEMDFTVLHYAIWLQRSEIAKLLIENNADVNAKDEAGKTPLHLACASMPHSSARNDLTEIIKILLNKGATVDTKEIDGKTALHFAVDSGYATAVKLLIENGADVAARNNNEETSLHIAAAGDSLKTIEILLNVFDDVNCRDEDGKTALHIAVERNNPEIVRLLLDHNSDINILSNCIHYYANPRRRYYSDSDGSDDNGMDLHCGRQQLNDWRRDAIEFSNRCAEEVGIILKHHIVKMIALNHYVAENHLQAVNHFDDYKQFHNRCKDEIECMRQKKIGVSAVSYYDVLTKSANQLVLYGRNKDIVDGLETRDHMHMFPLYSAMLHHRYENGQKRIGLLDLSLKSFRFLTGYALPDLHTIELLDYLSNEDLRNLIKAAP